MTQKIQYVIVFIILAVVIIWTVYHLARKKKGGASPCCGCGLADSCKKRHFASRRIRCLCRAAIVRRLTIAPRKRIFSVAEVNPTIKKKSRAPMPVLYTEFIIFAN